jgi:hypothetical protein
MNNDIDRPNTSDTLDTRVTDTRATDTRATDTRATDTRATDTRATDTRATDTRTPDVWTRNTSTPDSLDTSNSLEILDSPSTSESPNTSVSNTSNSTEEIESPRDSEFPRTSESSGTSEERAIMGYPMAKLEGFPYVTSFIRILTEKRTLRARLKTFNVSPLMDIPEEVMEILSHPAFDTAGFVGTKKRVGSLEARETRKWKRQREDDDTTTTALDCLQSLPVTVMEGSTASWSDMSSISLAEPSSPVLLTDDAITLSDRDIPDPVFNPQRLQGLLATIGIHCSFDAVVKCLRKAIVLRDSSANATDGLLVYPLGDIIKVQNLAEFLFASSLLEEAFPLFLHVWTVRRRDLAYNGAKSLIQCVRSAASIGDQALIGALLEREMLVSAQESPQHKLVQSLGYLELANLFQHQRHEETFELYHERARSICPSFGSLLDEFHEAGQKLHDIRNPQVIYGMDSLSEIITRQAFQHGVCSQYHNILAQNSDNNIGEHTLRDVLSATIYMRHPNRPNATAGICHIRNCLQLVFEILNSPSWLISYELCVKRIPQYLAGNPRSHEYALFLSLWVNWRSCQNPCHYLGTEEFKLEDKDTFFGLSGVEILSVITYCISSGKTFQDFVRSTFSSNDLGSLDIPLLKSERVLGLLQLPDEDLMFRFLWYSVKLSRMNTAEGRWRTDPLATLYKNMMIDTFVTGSCEDKNTTTQPKPNNTNRPCSAMTSITVNSTLAKSLSTTPTLASMRRQGRMSYSSTRSYWSNRAMTIDDLSDWASCMSISDLDNSRPVSVGDVPVGDGADPDLVGQNKEISLRNRVGPSKPLPPLPVIQSEDSCLPNPTSPIIIVPDSAPYNENPFTSVASDKSTETTVSPMSHKDSIMDYTPAADGTSTGPITTNRESILYETRIIHDNSRERPIVFEFDFPMPDKG